MAAVGKSGVMIVVAAAVLSAALLQGAASPDYGLISTSTQPAPPAIPVAPNDHGYVRVETKSGLTGCSIAAELVACQTSAGNWPSRPDGRRFHIASVSADGEFHWVDADLGALEGRVALEYQTYRPRAGRSPPPQTAPPSPMTTPATACPSANNAWHHSDADNSVRGRGRAANRPATRESTLMRSICVRQPDAGLHVSPKV
jgi:hypothetical protein